MALDLPAIRRQFPFLQHAAEGKRIVYLDGAATSQKPSAVMDALREFYETANGNPHRGMHPLAERATVAYEKARETVARFIHAASPEEIVFTKSTTEAINLVAQTYGKRLTSDDAILLSILEHHSNIVPWQQLSEETGVEIRWIDMNAEGELDMASFEKQMLDGKVKFVAITGLSNVLGTMPPLKKIIDHAHLQNAVVLVDAAQLAVHAPIDVQTLDCDFLALSGHKMYGPMGIGVLYAKKKILTTLPPFLGGGMMIREVTRDGFTAADSPTRFEAGTQSVADAVALAAAINWQLQYSWQDRMEHEQALLTLARTELMSIPDLTILGPADAHGCISFVIDRIHPHDLTDILGQTGICLRAGHHCAQPLHDRLGITASARLSVSIHTTEEEIRLLKPAILQAIKTLS